MVFTGDHVVFATTEIDEPELRQHKDQSAIVIKPVTDYNAEEGSIYRIRFPDGFECEAFIDELIPLSGARWGNK